MDFKFTEEQEMLRQSVRKLLDRVWSRELEREHDRTGEYPYVLWNAMAEAGFMGLPLPEEYGGSGGNVIDFCIMAEELGSLSAAARGVYMGPVLFGGEKIYYNASEAQKKEYLPRIARGELRFAFGLTEPNAGSDAANTQTKAVRDGDNYIINGNKIFITGSHVADYVMTVTRTDPTLPKHRGLTIFFVNTKNKGYSAKPLDKFGQRAVASCEVVYDDVVVPKEAILGGTECLNNGWRQMLTTLDVERIVIGASNTGEAALALQDAVQYAKERVQFGQPIGKFQAIQHMLAEVATEIEAARWLTYRAAWLRKENLPCSKEASMAKLFATEIAKKAALTGVQVMGGYGYMNEFDMQRYLRNSVLGPIGGGTSQIQKNIIARQIGL